MAQAQVHSVNLDVSPMAVLELNVVDRRHHVARAPLAEFIEHFQAD